MKDTAGPDFKVRYFTSCTGTTLHENNKCDGLKVGTTVNFTISIEVAKKKKNTTILLQERKHYRFNFQVLECPVNQSDRKQTLKFYPVGVNEVMNLELEMICDCPCERSGHPVRLLDAKCLCIYIKLYDEISLRTILPTQANVMAVEIYSVAFATVTNLTAVKTASVRVISISPS